MPPPRPRPVGPSGNATGQLAAFGLGVARRAAQATGNYSSTVAAVRAALPGILYANALRIASSGYSQAQRLAALSTGPEDRPIPTHLGQERAEQIPAWRYVFTFSCVLPSTGVSTTIRGRVDSSRQLTVGELKTQAAHQVNVRLERSPQAPGEGELDEAELCDFELIAVYCRSC